ncbi:MAG: hypothetical protein ABSD13_13355 [Candidatus Korobacteraceae bacterium]|jgi:transposase InsO family protein
MISVHESEKLSSDQVQRFLLASAEVRFEANQRAQVYAWVEQVLRQHEYVRQGRRARGLLRRYIGKMTGLSRAQITRLSGRYLATGWVACETNRRHRFARRYTQADIELLAQVEKAHDTLSGPATRRILEREFHEYGKLEFERLASISNGHLYNLRHTPRYRQRLSHYEKTRLTAVSLSERRKPDPQGKPEYLRIDTVHQGDSTNANLVYHINAVDEVTGRLWQPCPASPKPIWSQCWSPFWPSSPFRIHGFHSDNGSEFINQTVAKLLNKLMIEQTKSRPRHSNDNGLAETKNGAIIRKRMGWGYIEATQADRIHQFYTAYLNPYLNYHRPCAQADVETDSKERTIRHYQTPLETLLALPQPQQYLRSGLSLSTLERIAKTMSDTEAAQRMQQAKRRLFSQFKTA